MLKYNILLNSNVGFLSVYIFIEIYSHCKEILKYKSLSTNVRWRNQWNVRTIGVLEIQNIFTQIPICQNFFFKCLLICYLGHFFKNITSCTAGETVKITKVLNMLFIQWQSLGDIDLCLHFGSHLNLFTSSKQISYSWEVENHLCSEDLLHLLNTFAIAHET